MRIQENNRKIPQVAWIAGALIVLGVAWYVSISLERVALGPDDDGASIVVVGMLPFDGSESALALALQKAGELAAEEIEAQGGIGGKTLEVVWEDGGCDRRKAVNAVRALLERGEARYVLGGVCAGEVEAIAAAGSARAVFISPSMARPDPSRSGNLLFFTMASGDHMPRAAAQHARAIASTGKVAVLSEIGDASQGHRRAFKEVFLTRGGEVVADEIFRADADMSASIIKIRTVRPDVVYVVSETPDAGVRAAALVREQNRRAQIMVSDALLDPAVTETHADALEGVVGVSYVFDESAPKTREFISLFERRYGERPEFPEMMAHYYSYFFLLKEAIEAAGSGAVAVERWLMGMETWEHALGSIAFDDRGDVLPLYHAVKVENGKPRTTEVFRLSP